MNNKTHADWRAFLFLQNFSQHLSLIARLAFHGEAHDGAEDDTAQDIGGIVNHQDHARDGDEDGEDEKDPRIAFAMEEKIGLKGDERMSRGERVVARRFDHEDDRRIEDIGAHPVHDVLEDEIPCDEADKERHKKIKSRLAGLRKEQKDASDENKENASVAEMREVGKKRSDGSCRVGDAIEQGEFVGVHGMLLQKKYVCAVADR